MKALFVLRGRPGLGHVAPALALARELEGFKWKVDIATYGQGLLLARDALVAGRVTPLEVSEAYDDYPGLTLYDGGLRQVVPLIHNNYDALILGGEYELGLLSTLVDIPTIMIVNPEIFYADPRNEVTAPYFNLVLKNLAGIVPLFPLDRSRMIQSFEWVLDRLLPAGPFLLGSSVRRRSDIVLRKRQIMLAAGGGLNLPANTASYSQSELSPSVWIDQTVDTIWKCLNYLRKVLSPSDSVKVYGDVPGNAFHEMAANFGTDLRFTFSRPSMAYYEDLAQSSHLIFRAGAGATADAVAAEVPSILWPLRGHDEQTQNALREASYRHNIHAMLPGDCVEAAIDRLLVTALPIITPPNLAPNSELTAKRIQELGGRNA